MVNPASGVLLDACALIWLANGDPLSAQASEAITQAAMSAHVFVSPISAWEVGMLSKPRGARPVLRFLPDLKTWFAKVMAGPAICEAALTPGIAVDASYLPGNLHGDPADRLLIATARHLGIPMVTRDAKIVAYAKQGHVQAVPC